MESCEVSQMCYYGSVCKASGFVGVSIGTGFTLLLRSILSREDMLMFGWRIPFLCSILFSIFGIYLRSKLEDDDEDLGETATVRTPQTPHTLNTSIENSIIKKVSNHSNEQITMCGKVSELCRSYWRDILITLIASSFWIVGYYTLFIWNQYYMSSIVGLGGVRHAWLISWVSISSLIVTIPIGGYLCDLINQSPIYNKSGDATCGPILVMKISITLLIILLIPCYGLLNTRTISGCFVACFIFSLLIGIYGGSLPAFLVLRFPSSVRCTGVGLGYNLSNAIFAGTVTSLQTYLAASSKRQVSYDSIRDNHDRFNINIDTLLHDGRFRPSYYIILIGVMSLLSLLFYLPYNDSRKRAHGTHYTDLSTDINEHTSNSNGSSVVVIVAAADDIIHDDYPDHVSDGSFKSCFDDHQYTVITTKSNTILNNV